MKLRNRLVVYDGDAQIDHVSPLRQEFELVVATSLESLQKLVATEPIDGVVIHFYILEKGRLSAIEKLNGFAAWLPLIVLADNWDLDAVKHGGQIGVQAFLACDDKPNKKLATVSSAIRTGGFRKLLAEAARPPITWPVCMNHAVDLILETFPKVLSICELSAALVLQR